jgi:ABC-type dipeptide/oligopeptide/nickel transport system permease component
MPTFWIALVALYVGFFKLGWFPGAERLDPGVLPPPHKTGLYTIDALPCRSMGALRFKPCITSCCLRSCLPPSA